MIQRFHQHLNILWMFRPRVNLINATFKLKLFFFFLNDALFFIVFVSNIKHVSRCHRFNFKCTQIKIFLPHIIQLVYLLLSPWLSLKIIYFMTIISSLYKIFEVLRCTWWGRALSIKFYLTKIFLELINKSFFFFLLINGLLLNFWVFAEKIHKILIVFTFVANLSYRRIWINVTLLFEINVLLLFVNQFLF